MIITISTLPTLPMFGKVSVINWRLNVRHLPMSRVGKYSVFPWVTEHFSSFKSWSQGCAGVFHLNCFFNLPIDTWKWETALQSSADWIPQTDIKIRCDRKSGVRAPNSLV